MNFEQIIAHKLVGIAERLIVVGEIRKPADVDQKFWEALVEAADDVVDGKGNFKNHVKKLKKQFPTSDEEDITSIMQEMIGHSERLAADRGTLVHRCSCL